MTREQILKIVQAAPDVGQVKHAEFADYVIALSHRKKGEDGWQTTENPYMTVDGKLAMANQDHARQGKRLEFSVPRVLVDNDDQLTLLVMVTSEIYGTRHGIATSRRIGGTEVERLFSWEVAETSAIGRALSAMGYGLFPGSGLSSADDMLRATSETVRPAADRRAADSESRASVNPPKFSANEPRSGYGSKRAQQPPLSSVQRNKLLELWRAVNGGGELEAIEGLDVIFQDAFKHGMNEATYEEGARITGQLLSELRQRTS